MARLAVLVVLVVAALAAPAGAEATQADAHSLRGSVKSAVEIEVQTRGLRGSVKSAVENKVRAVVDRLRELQATCTTPTCAGDELETTAQTLNASLGTLIPSLETMDQHITNYESVKTAVKNTNDLITITQPLIAACGSIPKVGAAFSAVSGALTLLKVPVKTLNTAFGTLWTSVLNPWQTAISSLLSGLDAITVHLESFGKALGSFGGLADTACLRPTLETLAPVPLKATFSAIDSAVPVFLTLVAQLKQAITGVVNALASEAVTMLHSTISSISTFMRDIFGAINHLQPIVDVLDTEVELPWFSDAKLRNPDPVAPVPHTCPPGTTKSGSSCYKNCKEGFSRSTLVSPFDAKCSYGGCGGLIEIPMLRSCLNPVYTRATKFIPCDRSGCSCGDWDQIVFVCVEKCKSGYNSFDIAGVQSCYKASCPTGFSMTSDKTECLRPSSYTIEANPLECSPGYKDPGCLGVCPSGYIEVGIGCLKPRTQKFKIRKIAEEVDKLAGWIFDGMFKSLFNDELIRLVVPMLEPLLPLLNNLNLPLPAEIPGLNLLLFTVDKLPVADLLTKLNALTPPQALVNALELPRKIEDELKAIATKAQLPTDWATCTDFACLSSKLNVGLFPSLDLSALGQHLQTLNTPIASRLGKIMDSLTGCDTYEDLTIDIPTELGDLLQLPADQVIPCEIKVPVCTKLEFDQNVLDTEMARIAALLHPVIGSLDTIKMALENAVNRRVLQSGALSEAARIPIAMVPISFIGAKLSNVGLVTTFYRDFAQWKQTNGGSATVAGGYLEFKPTATLYLTLIVQPGQPVQLGLETIAHPFFEIVRSSGQPGELLVTAMSEFYDQWAQLQPSECFAQERSVEAQTPVFKYKAKTTSSLCLPVAKEVHGIEKLWTRLLDNLEAYPPGNVWYESKAGLQFVSAAVTELNRLAEKAFHLRKILENGNTWAQWLRSVAWDGTARSYPIPVVGGGFMAERVELGEARPFVSVAAINSFTGRGMQVQIDAQTGIPRLIVPQVGYLSSLRERWGLKNDFGPNIIVGAPMKFRIGAGVAAFTALTPILGGALPLPDIQGDMIKLSRSADLACFNSGKGTYSAMMASPAGFQRTAGDDYVSSLDGFCLGGHVSWMVADSGNFLDVACTTSAGKTSIKLGAAGGVWTALPVTLGAASTAATEWTFGAPGRLHWSDLNSDGLDDMVALDTATGTVKARLSTAAGAFGELTDLLSAATACTGSDKEAHIEDVNGDGVADIICFDSATGDLAMFASRTAQATQWSSTPVTAQTSCAGLALQVADWDGDGRADVACHTAAFELLVYMAEADGSHFGTHLTMHDICSAGRVLLADVTGSGKADAVCHLDDNGKVVLYESVGRGVPMYRTNAAYATSGGFCTAAGSTLFSGPRKADVTFDVGPFQIVRNKVLRQVTLGEAWALSFKLRPTGTVSDYANILHVGSTNDERAPAIFFYPGGTLLHVRVGIEGDSNWGCNPASSLSLNTWHSITVEVSTAQRLLVTVDGSVECDVAMPAPFKVLGSRPLYVADDFYEPAIADIHALEILSKPFQIVRNKVLRQVTLGEAWALSFKLRPTGTVSDYANILHVGSTNDERAPAIFFYPGGTLLHVRVGIEGDSNWGCNPASSLSLNTWHSITVEVSTAQRLLVTVDGSVECDVAMPAPFKVLGSRPLYVADDYYEPARAEMFQLVVSA